MQSVRSSHEKVYLIVRLSVNRVICDKTKQSCAHILMSRERSFILVIFVTRRMVRGDPWNFGTNLL